MFRIFLKKDKVVNTPKQVIPDTLLKLAENVQQRFPDKLPKIQVTGEEVALLQGQQQVIEYILTYLQVNSEEINRDDILRDS